MAPTAGCLRTRCSRRQHENASLDDDDTVDDDEDEEKADVDVDAIVVSDPLVASVARDVRGVASKRSLLLLAYAFDIINDTVF